MDRLLFLLAGGLIGFFTSTALTNHSITCKLNLIMATLADFQAAFAEINEATTNIAADIERLTGQLGSNLSAADEEAALTELKGIGTQLKAIAATTPDGDPTPPPTS